MQISPWKEWITSILARRPVFWAWNFSHINFCNLHVTAFSAVPYLSFWMQAFWRCSKTNLWEFPIREQIPNGNSWRVSLNWLGISVGVVILLLLLFLLLGRSGIWIGPIFSTFFFCSISLFSSSIYSFFLVVVVGFWYAWSLIKVRSQTYFSIEFWSFT